MDADGLATPAHLLADHLVERNGAIRQGDSAEDDGQSVVESVAVLALELGAQLFLGGHVALLLELRAGLDSPSEESVR